MKTSSRLMFAMLLAGFGGASMAQEILPEPTFTPTKTRAQVIAELKQARLDGSIHASSDTYVQPFVATRSRQEVRDEVIAALRSGEQLASQRASDSYQRWMDARPVQQLARPQGSDARVSSVGSGQGAAPAAQ